MAGGASPRFRQDLEANAVEADGLNYVEVSDRESGRSFRFYEFEHAVAKALDGSSLEQVAARLREGNQIDLTVDQLAAFADQLHALGFLASDTPLPFFPPSLPDEGATPPPVPAPSTVSAPVVPADPLAWTSAAPAPAPEAPQAGSMEAPAEAPAAPAPPPAAAATTAPNALGLGLTELGLSADAAPSTPSEPAASEGIEPPTVPALVEPSSGAAVSATSAAEAGAAAPVAAEAPAPPPALTLAELASSPVAPPPALTLAELASSPAPAAEPARGSEAAADVADPITVPVATPAPGAPAGEAVPAPLAAKPAADDEQLRPTVPTHDAAEPAAAAAPALSVVPPPGGDADLPAPVLNGQSNGAHRERSNTQEVATAQVLESVPSPAARPADVMPAVEPGEASAAPPTASAVVEPTLLLPEHLQSEAPAPVSAPAAEPAAKEPAPAAKSSTEAPAVPARPTWVLYAALGVGAAVIVAAVLYRFVGSTEPPPVAVRTMVPSPTSVYRFFATTAKVEAAAMPAYTFPTAGRVLEVLPAGTRFQAGDVLALLDSGRQVRADLAHYRQRLEFYEQQLQTSTAKGDKIQAHQAELKIAEKKRFIAEATAALAKNGIVAPQAGEVAEAVVAVGARVNSGAPGVRAKGGGLRATFELGREEAEQARHLGFCRAEIDGHPLDCTVANEGGDETHVSVDLPVDPAVAPGKTARLAKSRLDAVFAVPTSAIVRVSDTDRLYVVVAGRADLRVVSLAERGDSEAIVTQGIDVGDQVIVDPHGLRAESRVLVKDTVRQ